MNALRLSLAFRRPDVDQFLSEIDCDQYLEWLAYFTLEPQGWDAINRQTARLSLITAQVHTRRTLRERDFLIKLGSNEYSPEVDKARWEAYAIRQNIMEGKISG